ncbi:hypothetical protein GCM10007858_31290 [Bradyrhizobium liaoningense]|nr:hypothetical protein GCM10007858_31290 [Bradyrhizobium liaoningense]
MTAGAGWPGNTPVFGKRTHQRRQRIKAPGALGVGVAGRQTAPSGVKWNETETPRQLAMA